MKNICLNWTISLLTGLFVLFMLTIIGFIFHIQINFLYLPISVIVFFIVFFYKTECLKSALAQLIILFDFIILTGALCYFIPDFSYDGTTYHQAMIILLKLGLNPIYDNISTFANNQEYVFSSSIIYVENFLKFFEIIGANIYFIFEKIELTKITNYIFMLIAFCYSFYTLKNYEFSNAKSSFFAFLFIYNPVCIYQMLSNYVDGAFYYMFLVLLLAMINYTKGCDKTKSLYLICITAVILANLKLTGLFSVLIIAIVFSIVYKSKKVLTSFLIAGALILLSGINPYFTNIKQGRSPFYPIITNSISNANREFMITSYPQGFENKNRFEKFFFSLFAVSKNLSPLIKSKDVPRLKFPFTIVGDDIFNTEDMRLGGFGYFFSGIIILSLLISLSLRFKSKEDKKTFFTVIAILLITIFGNHEAWWARFVPQLWILPVLILIFSVMHREKHVSAYIIAGVCIINSLIINIQYFASDIARTKEDLIQKTLLDKIIYVPAKYPENEHRFETAPVKLQEYDIKVIYINN